VKPFALVIAALLISLKAGAQDPDFDAFLDLTTSALEQAGNASIPGEKTELVRYTDDGWQLLISAAWGGEHWRLLALRIHHPDRIEAPDQRWAQQYQTLLRELEPEQIADIEPPELFEVPPPDFLPALPEELRSRQFDIGQFWYQARWINSGGFDHDAEWSLRSYELVARPPSDQ
jgi:hypothetical protein